MRPTKPILTLAATAVFAATGLAPIAAHASAASRQKNKNTWRNLGYGAAGVAGYGLLKHNTAATLLGAAGAAYSAHRYEQDRHSQDQHQRARTRYYHHGGDYVRNGKKYYKYQGKMYYMNLRTGERHRVG